jgi:hypothetical protein
MHHWYDSRLKSQTQNFLKIFNSSYLNKAKDNDVWAMALMLYPTKGTIKSKKRSIAGKPACEPLFKTLKKEGIDTFRAVFGNNN